MANTINRFSGSVIARLKVGKNPQNVQMYQGEELKEFLLFLDAKLGIQNKAHKNILLLNHISRFLDEDRLRPSWSTVRRLRKAVASDADSLLPASIFFRDCPRLSSGQLQRLSEDFRGLQWGAELQPFFTFAQNIKVENLTSPGCNPGVFLDTLAAAKTGVDPAGRRYYNDQKDTYVHQETQNLYCRV
jgi:hypothetical protein